jgi:hypothetical protein
MNLYILILDLLQLKNTLQLVHWTTSSYAKHKATDNLIEQLQSKTDEYTEVAIGCDIINKKKFKKLLIEKYNLKPLYKFEENHSFIIELCNRIIKNLELSKIEILSKQSDLQNITDEIIGHIHQFIYLMSFK